MKKKSLKILSSEFDAFTLNSDLFIYFNDEKIAGLKPVIIPLIQRLVLFVMNI